MERQFEIVSAYSPQGDQPVAIEKLVEGINSGKKKQVLLGATGTGKTFTISNVIKEVQKPTRYSHQRRQHPHQSPGQRQQQCHRLWQRKRRRL